MDIFKVFEKRYSHKEGFLPDAVSLEDLKRIAEAGISAPSGVNRQSVRLVILPNRDAIAPVCAIAPTIGLETAPAAIAVLTDKTVTPSGEMNFEKEDYSAAVENMLLAATALGYVSLWLDSPYFDAKKEAAARAVLDAPETMRLWAVLPIGKPDGAGSRREKLPFDARVSVDKFHLNRL
ncbi:MAG: nitroreductase family protein [Defluviitaleaceae bacterium]|nr:nitroreductase family protein [Defluviitaleaceae bacterium]